MYYIDYLSPIGKLIFIEENEVLVEINFGTVKGIYKETPLLLETKKQFDDYFHKKRKSFNLPYQIQTTDFRVKVLNEVNQITYGQTKTYKEIAENVSCPKGYQAIGQAIHHNPLPILIPCHRVLGKNQNLTGYAFGLDKKAYLLALEKGD